jgi:hypothetical protein
MSAVVTVLVVNVFMVYTWNVVYNYSQIFKGTYVLDKLISTKLPPTFLHLIFSEAYCFTLPGFIFISFQIRIV